MTTETADAAEITPARERRRRVTIATGDPVGALRAGPVIRAWEMATALSRGHDVTLVSFAGVDAEVVAPFGLAHIDRDDDDGMAEILADTEVFISQGMAHAMFPSVRAADCVMVFDLYAPITLESLEQNRGRDLVDWVERVDLAAIWTNDQLSRGDFFLCSSARQRLYYLGQLAGAGRVNPLNYRSDPDLGNLLSIVPFGLPEDPPVATGPGVRGRVEGIEDGDEVVVWAGGLYDWLDPLTLIRAVAELSVRRPRVRLFFMGTRHPNPAVPEMEIVARSRALADELGVTNRHVFFNDEWVPYDERQNYLLDADLGVSTHKHHLETTMSFRTRILDYLWCGLPMVVSDGDHFADVVRAEQLGVVVEPGDVSALANGIEALLADESARGEARARIAAIARESRWSQVMAPVVEFVDRAAPAPDRVWRARRADELAAIEAERLAAEAAVAAQSAPSSGAIIVQETRSMLGRLRARFRERQH